MARGDKRGGLISHGTCEGCKLDLGNRLDPYCWRCAQMLERAAAQRMAERRRVEREPYSSLGHPAGPCLMGCGLCAAY